MNRESGRETSGMPFGAETVCEPAWRGDAEAEVFRCALQRQESERAGGLPSFASIASRIEEHPSQLDAQPWTAGRSLRISTVLAGLQLRVVPYAVVAAALVMAVAAVCAAYLASASAALDPTWLLSVLLLVGAALTVSLALSSERADSLALATPIGPQTVTLVRIGAVLLIDVVAGIGSCCIAALLGLPPDPAGLVATWLAPLAAVTGVSAFVAVWTGSSWAGSIVGLASVPFVIPLAQAGAVADVAPFVSLVQEALGPAGIVALGIALLAAAVCSAKRAMLARLQAA